MFDRGLALRRRGGACWGTLWFEGDNLLVVLCGEGSLLVCFRLRGMNLRLSSMYSCVGWKSWELLQGDLNTRSSARILSAVIEFYNWIQYKLSLLNRGGFHCSTLRETMKVQALWSE